MKRWRYAILALIIGSFATLATVAISELHIAARQPVYPSAWLWLGDSAIFVVSARLLYLAIRPRKPN